MTNKERKDLAKWAIDFAQKKGATEVAASISNSRAVEIEVREQKVDKIKESTQNGLYLQIYRDNKYSGHSTNNLNKKELEKFISEAVEATKYLSADEFRALPDPELYPSGDYSDLQLKDDSYSKVDPEKRLAIAMEIERLARAQSDQIISATGGYSDDYSESVRVHSNGFMGERISTSFWAGAEVTVKDGDARPEGYFWGGARHFAEMPSPEELAQKAASDALERVGQTKIESGKYDMLVENRSVGRLLYMFVGPMSARALQQKSSYLEGMLNQPIASPLLTITDDPTIPKGFGSRHYDNEGLKAEKRVMIEKGILKQYYVDNYYGKKLGIAANGGSPSNVIFELGERDKEAMVKSIKNGILVTSFNGGNSNGTTGDFSFGVSGFLIRNGEISKPVNEMNISGNAKEFWQLLSEVGNDPYAYSSLKCPTMLFTGIDFSGI